MDKPTWVAALKQTIAEARTARPATPDAALTPIARAQRGVHAAVTSEFQRQAQGALREREILLERMGDHEPEPVVVLTGDDAFLAAFLVMYPDDKILRGGGRYFLPLHEDEYVAFLARTPEPNEFRYHVHWWSIFDAPVPRDAAFAERHGLDLAPGARYVDHRVGFLWGPRHGSQWISLWQLDGDQLELVQQDYVTMRY